MSRAIVFSFIILGALFLFLEKGLFSFKETPGESFDFTNEKEELSKSTETKPISGTTKKINFLEQSEITASSQVDELSESKDFKFFPQEENDQRVSAVRDDMIKSGFTEDRINQLLSEELKKPVYYFNGERDAPEILYEGKAVEILPEDQRINGFPVLGLGAIQALSSSSLNNTEIKEGSSELIARDAYSLFRFTPGTVFDGVTKIEQEGIFRESIKGPDHPIDIVLPKDTSSIEYQVALDDMRSKSLSLGDRGEVVLRVENGGQVFNGSGADFSIFGTLTFDLANIERNPALVQLGQIGVAWNNDKNEYKWFPCNAEKLSLNELRGCAGLKTQQSGGDQFDLALIGVSAARFIKIRDTCLLYTSPSPRDRG